MESITLAPTPPRPRRVLIIGGGPVGLVTLRNFLHRAQFDVVQLVERRAEVGGVWYLDPPQSPNDPRPRWPSPAYPGLMGNVLPSYLSFSGHPFPPPSTPDQPFPDLIQTQKYLLKFAEPLRLHIRLNTEVVRVDELEGGQGWDVVLRDWTADGKEVVERWDAVVVATAWYDNPKWPDTPGLEELKEAGIARHSREWKGPSGVRVFKSKRIAVIGNANSANDIASQLAEAGSELGSESPIYPIYRSIRRPNMHYFPILPHPNLRAVAPVARFSVVVGGDEGEDKKESTKGEDGTKDMGGKTTTAMLHLADGTSIPNIDYVFFGTGYAYYIPFVRVLSPPSLSLPPSPSTTVTKPTRTLHPLCPTPPTPTTGISSPPVPSLHRHILYAPNPTLAFLGGIVSATPFILGDVASTWVALFWCPSSVPGPSAPPEKSKGEAKTIPFPNTLPDLLESERTRLQTVANILTAITSKDPSAQPTSLIAYHILGPEELEYARGLWADVGLVRADYLARGAGGEGEGLVEWTDEMWAEKEAMFGLKDTVLRRGAGLEVPVSVGDKRERQVRDGDGGANSDDKGAGCDE